MAFRSYGNAERFNPTQVPDQANRILQQGQNTLRALQRAQDFDLQNRGRYAQAMSNVQRLEEGNRELIFNLDRDNRQRVQDQIQRNYLQTIRDAEVQGRQEIQTLQALATFSDTAFKAVATFNQKREEGIKLGVQQAIYATGLDLKGLQEIYKLDRNLTDQALSENTKVKELLDNGASIKDIRYLMKNSNAKYWNENRGLAEQIGSGFGSYSNDNYQTKYKVGENEVSMAEAIQSGQFDAVELILSQQRSQYLRESGALDISPQVAAAYIFPQMQAYESQVRQSVNAQERKSIDTEVRNNINQAFEQGLSTGGAAWAAQYIADKPAGTERSAAKANLLNFLATAASGDDAERYQAVFQDILNQSTTRADGSETTLGEFWKNDPAVIEVSRAFVDARRRKLQDLNLKEQEDLAQVKEREDYAIQALQELPNGYTDADIDGIYEFIREVRPGYVSDRLENMRRNESTNAVYRQKIEAQLQKLLNGGVLTEEELDRLGVPAEIAAKFRGAARAISADRKANENFKPQMDALAALVKSPPQIQAKADGTYNFTVPLMTQQLQNKFLTKYSQLKAGGDPNAVGAAFSLVQQEFQAQINNPSFFDNKRGAYIQFLQATKPNATASTRIAKVLNSIAKIEKPLDAPGAIFNADELARIEVSMSKPGYKMDPMAEYVGRLMGVSPFSVINRQRIAAGMSQMELPQAAVTFSTTVNPILKRKLDAYQTPEISARAMMSTRTFDPNLVPKGYGPLVVEAAQKAGITPVAVAALAEAENGAWDPNIFSGGGYKWDGASTGVGLMQLSQVYNGPGSSVEAREQALRDPKLNLTLGAGALSKLYKKYGNWKDAVFAWNMGETGYANWEAAGRPKSDVQSQRATKLYERFEKARAKYGDTSALRSPATMRPSMRRFGTPSFEKPSSVVFETSSGQPGVDLYFESKRFPAVLGGVVKDVSRESGYGNYVVIESVDPQTGQKVDVLYGHLADGIKLKPGQAIEAGDIIGTQGGTGNVRSVDGTIASIDFLAPAPRGSKSMKPYAAFDSLRRYVVSQMQR